MWGRLKHIIHGAVYGGGIHTHSRLPLTRHHTPSFGTTHRQTTNSLFPYSERHSLAFSVTRIIGPHTYTHPHAHLHTHALAHGTHALTASVRGRDCAEPAEKAHCRLIKQGTTTCASQHEHGKSPHQGAEHCMQCGSRASKPCLACALPHLPTFVPARQARTAITASRRRGTFRCMTAGCAQQVSAARATARQYVSCAPLCVP